VASLVTPISGDLATAELIAQLTELLSGLRNIPVSLTGVNDGSAYVLTLKNAGTGSKGLIIYAADGTTILFQADDSGVRASRAGAAAERVLTTGESATVTTAMLANQPMVKLAELAGAAASYDFTSIPQTYRHLMLEVYGRSDTAATSTSLRMRIQNLSTAIYYDQRSVVAGTSVSADESLGATSARVGLVSAASAPAPLMGTATILLPHYTQANKEKPYIAHSTVLLALSTGGIQIAQFGGVADNSSAIDRITIFPLAGSFVADSIATLYGLPL
jgi:hypothetical protein